MASTQELFLLGLIVAQSSAIPEPGTMTRAASVLRHDDKMVTPSAINRLTTTVNSEASSLLPLSQVRMRREDSANSNLHRQHHAPVDQEKNHMEAIDKQRLEQDIKIWESEAALLRSKKALDADTRSQRISSKSDQVAEPLPKGWKAARDPKTWHLYYYKKDMKEKGGFKVQWQRPVQSSAALVKQQQAPPGATGATKSGKPPNLGAFEEDEFNTLSEYFGPFRLDYADHNIELPNWNLVVESPQDIPGRGNLIVGRENYLDHASNSFVAGKHMTVIGRDNTVAGGKDNFISGNNSVIIGGQQNTARGLTTFVQGGYRNEADGKSSSVGGGYQNLATGTFSSAMGGRDNIVSGYLAVGTGGRLNVASGNLAAIHGGDTKVDSKNRTGVIE